MKRLGFVLLLAAAMVMSASHGSAAVGWVFFNGSSYFNTPTLGASNQPIGRASVATGVIVNGELTGTTVTLSGTRTGLSNFKMWVSTDNTFDGGDTQFGSTVAADPGGSAMEFNGSSIQPASTTFYVFLTADVDIAGVASGSVLPTMSGMTSIPQIFSFAPGAMASGAEPLPITVSLISAE
jgi:hypothetical protein